MSTSFAPLHSDQNSFLSCTVFSLIALRTHMIEDMSSNSRHKLRVCSDKSLHGPDGIMIMLNIHLSDNIPT